MSAADGAEYTQPTPRLLYVHDDLTDEVARDLIRKLLAELVAWTRKLKG